MISVAHVKKALLFYAPQMKGLAQRIAAEAEAVQLCTISWSRQSDDGFAAITIEEPWKIRGSVVFFLASFDDPECIYEQFAVMSKIPRLGPSVFKIFLPCFPSLTLANEGGERGRGLPGEVPCSHTMTRILSLIPRGKSGPTEIVIFDIHHLQEQFYFEDHVIPRLETSIRLLLDRLDQVIYTRMMYKVNEIAPPSDAAGVGVAAGGDSKEGKESPARDAEGEADLWSDKTQQEVLNLRAHSTPGTDARKRLDAILQQRRRQDAEAPLIAFSDEKTAKRFGKYFPGFSQVVCSKMLKDGKDNMVVLEGDPRGRSVVLVDDIIFTGGTMLKCGQLLREAGAVRVSCYVTHGFFSMGAWRKFVHGPFDRVWITDSNATMAEVLERHGPPFEVMTLAPLIAPMMDHEALESAEDDSMPFAPPQPTLSRL